MEASSAPAFQNLGVVEGLCILAVYFLVNVLIFALAAWATSAMLGLPKRDFPSAFKFSLFQYLIPVPVGIVLGALAGLAIATGGNAAAAALGGIAAALVVMFLLSVLITQKVYGIGCAGALVFGLVLLLVNCAIGTVLGFLGSAADLIARR